MAEVSSPSDVAIREFSKYRSHLLYAERKQSDAGRWEPAADRLLRRARVQVIWAAILALMLLMSPSPFTMLFCGALVVSCVREAARLRTAVRIVREAAGAEVVPPPRPGLAPR